MKAPLIIPAGATPLDMKDALERFAGLLSVLVNGKLLTGEALDTSVREIAHGLGSVPTGVLPHYLSAAAIVSFPQAATATHIYVQASVVCTANLYVY